MTGCSGVSSTPRRFDFIANALEYWVARSSRTMTTAKSKLFRTGIDNLPEFCAVLDLLHLGGEPAVALDPVLHRIRIIGHQVRCPLGAGDLDAEGKRLVVIGLVKAEAGPRRHAHLVNGHDAEYQGAGRIADAINDDALLAVADALVLRLVFADIAAVIARDMEIGARRRRGRKREQQQSERRDAHGSAGNRIEPVGTRESRSLSGPDGTTLAGLCWNLVKHPGRAENPGPVANFPHF